MEEGKLGVTFTLDVVAFAALGLHKYPVPPEPEALIETEVPSHTVEDNDTINGSNALKTKPLFEELQPMSSVIVR
jgi:hypothetical protein